MFWPRDGLRVRPGRAVIEFLAPIPAGMSSAQTVQRVETVVEAASDRLMQEAGFDPDRGQPG
ncbi:MAG TPA: 1-acyl-sn-glycerol-3-phosphate acyltransferase, partial [Paracoccus sp.]|nr:1-acyl-sn-glycerol-3-phosphate acyltransferase [Paracoccus sp. (in: a-proteobacteria)]